MVVLGLHSCTRSLVVSGAALHLAVGRVLPPHSVFFWGALRLMGVQGSAVVAWTSVKPGLSGIFLDEDGMNMALHIVGDSITATGKSWKVLRL